MDDRLTIVCITSCQMRMVNYHISMTRQLLSNKPSLSPETNKEQQKEDADHPVKTGADGDNNNDKDKDEERGRSTHRRNQSQQITNTSTSTGSRSRSRSASISRQSSRRPRREAAVSISPIRAVYNHAERDDAYLNNACRRMSGTRTRSGRSSVRISPGTWYDRSPHLRYGLAHETRTKRSKSPDRDDDEDEDVIVKRMVNVRRKKLTKKEDGLVRYWVGGKQEEGGSAQESAEEVLAWDAFAEARRASSGD